MNSYRFNAVMVGALYIMGTVFGILSTVLGGELISSIVKTNLLNSAELFNAITSTLPKLIGGSFLILLMGISLVMMTIFLYPIFKKDSEELALGMIVFRGTLEGVWYFITTLSVLFLFTLGNEFVSNGSNSDNLRSTISAVYQFQSLLGPLGTIFFLIGATCIYISFFRTRLIPRWLSIWGLFGVLPYMAYAILHFFGMDNGFGLYLQMILAPQEIVMALWLIIKGFNRNSIENLMKK